MDRWIDGQMDSWIDGQMDIQIEGYKGRREEGQMDILQLKDLEKKFFNLDARL